ncbi:hypothetical protein [Segatella sp.]|uniref:hypothetical protein n=1 Tax=Segatella sp. TaxID=2974253 RepID=UPI003079281C
MKINELLSLIKEDYQRYLKLENKELKGASLLRESFLVNLFNNYVDFSTRQKIGQLCKLRLVDNTGINQKKLYNRD